MRHRVIRHQLEPWFDPGIVFSTLYGGSDRAFWLDSGIGARSGFSYMGEGIRSVTVSDSSGSLVFDPPVPGAEGEPPLDIFEFLASRQTPVETTVETDASDAQGRFRLGWVGWLGYELRTRTMGVSRAGDARRSRYPDAAWLEIVRAVEFDHSAGTVTLLALGDDWSGEQGEWRDSVAAALSTGTVHRPDVQSTSSAAVPQLDWRYSDDEYLAMIAQCQSAITDGDAYQLCLTTEVAVDIRPDPLACYLALRATSPSHHGGYLRVGEISLLSSSPERFLSISAEGVIESKPIKGTRGRGETREEDLALRAELETSEKERAENLMIVDLMRNDIARVSEVGSVTVPDLLAVESYAQVHQLVSTVHGRLAPGLRPMDAVVACFPAGSMTGAPKSSATSILDRLEGRPRGIYSGVFGYAGLDGSVDLAMVIRSIVLDGTGATIGTGGGITALSVPEEELDEVKLKAAALLAVLGACAR